MNVWMNIDINFPDYMEYTAKDVIVDANEVHLITELDKSK